MQPLKRIIDRGGGCTQFICKCCPPVYLQSSKRGVILSAKTVGMSAFWLEAIATELGTFWPVSEREFLVETMFASDSDGKQHVRWLSTLISGVGAESDDETPAVISEGKLSHSAFKPH
jgi:hypothetical protein